MSTRRLRRRRPVASWTGLAWAFAGPLNPAQVFYLTPTAGRSATEVFWLVGLPAAFGAAVVLVSLRRPENVERIAMRTLLVSFLTAGFVAVAVGVQLVWTNLDRGGGASDLDVGSVASLPLFIVVGGVVGVPFYLPAALFAAVIIRFTAFRYDAAS